MFILTSKVEKRIMGRLFTLLFDRERIIGCTKTEWDVLNDGPDMKPHRSGQSYESVQAKIAQWSVLDENNNQFQLAVINDKLVVLENDDDEEPSFPAMLELEWFQRLNSGDIE